MGDSSEVNGPHMVGHVHLKVRDVEQPTDFYTDSLGLEFDTHEV